MARLPHPSAWTALRKDARMLLKRRQKPVAVQELRDGLLEVAKNYPSPDAVGDSEYIAVEALIEATGPTANPYWLAQPGFVARFVWVAKKPDQVSGVRHAYVLWEDATAALDAGNLDGPVWATRALRLAASMAVGVPVSLRDCLASGRVSGLDLAEAADYAAERQS